MTGHHRRSVRDGLGRGGFMLPAGLFALIIMTVLMIAAIRLADDERRSSRALREEGVALYAAEGGLSATVGSWPAGASALNPGDSLNLGWTTLANGAQYRAVIHRVDNGGTKAFAVIVEGRGAGALGGRGNVTQFLTTTSAPGNGFVALGDFGLNTGNTADSYNSTGCGTPATDGCYSATKDSSVTILAGTTVDVHGAYVYGSIQAGSTINTSGTVLTGSSPPNMTPSPVIAANSPPPACPAAYSPASDLNPLGGATYSGGSLVVGSSAHLV